MMRDGSIVTVYGLLSVESNVSQHFFSSRTLEVHSWPDSRLQKDAENCMLGKE